MAQNPSNVIPDQLIVVEGDAGFVPKAEPSDAGKVLKVDSQGTPVWGEDSGGTAFEPSKGLQLVDGKLSVKIGSGYGITNNMNGEGIVGVVAGDSTLRVTDGGVIVTRPLPASTSADADKVLTVNSSGTPEWATAQGGGGGTTVGSDLKTVLHASTPVAKSLEQTFSGGAYPGETCLITSYDVSGTIAAVHVPKARFYFQPSAPGLPGSTVQMGLYKNGTLIKWLSSAKAEYTRGYYHLSFPESWYIPDTPLAALGTGERYHLILSYSSAGSYSRPVGGQAQFFPYSDTDRFIVPDCTFSGALKPSSANMPSVSLQIDSDKGIYEKETLDEYGSPSYKLSVNNAVQMYDWDNYQQPSDLSVDRLEIQVPLQDDNFNDSGYQKKFPYARDFQKYGGQNHGTYDALFSFNGSSPQGGDVYVVHIEAPATASTAVYGDHVAFCVFTLCETVEDWDAGTNTNYYHNFALPGIYRGNHGGKFMADGIITISGSHSNGMFSAQLYSGELTVIPMESGVTITPSFGVDGWNFCVSKI